MPASAPADKPRVGGDDPTGGREELVGSVVTIISVLEGAGADNKVVVAAAVEPLVSVLELAADPVVAAVGVPMDDGTGVGVGLPLRDVVESPSTEAALDRNGAALRMTSWQSDSLSIF